MDSKFELPEYDMVLRRRGGKFHLITRELTIIGSGFSAEEAMEDYRKKAEELVGQYAAADALDEFPKPARVTSKHLKSVFEMHTISLFALKTSIIAVIVLLVAYGGVNIVGGQITRQAEQMKSAIASRLSPKAIAVKMINILSEVSKAEIPPERKQQILRDLNILVHKIKPYADEIKPLFDQNNNGKKNKETGQ